MCNINKVNRNPEGKTFLLFLLVCRQTRTTRKFLLVYQQTRTQKTGTNTNVLVSLSTNKNIMFLFVDKITRTWQRNFSVLVCRQTHKNFRNLVPIVKQVFVVLFSTRNMPKYTYFLFL